MLSDMNAAPHLFTSQAEFRDFSAEIATDVNESRPAFTSHPKNENKQQMLASCEGDRVRDDIIQCTGVQEFSRGDAPACTPLYEIGWNSGESGIGVQRNHPLWPISCTPVRPPSSTVHSKTSFNAGGEAAPTTTSLSGVFRLRPWCEGGQACGCRGAVPSLPPFPEDA